MCVSGRVACKSHLSLRIHKIFLQFPLKFLSCLKDFLLKKLKTNLCEPYTKKISIFRKPLRFKGNRDDPHPNSCLPLQRIYESFSRILANFLRNHFGMGRRLWINQWFNPLNVCRGTVPSAQIVFYWIYGAQNEINFHFYDAQLQMSKSLWSLASLPLYIYDAFRWNFPFYSHCGSLATLENLSLVHNSCVCARKLVLLPSTFMLTFSFLSASNKKFFSPKLVRNFSNDE